MNLNDQYKADMIRHNLWMANSQRQREEFQETMRQIDEDTAKVERFLAESCEDCGQHVPSEGHELFCKSRPDRPCPGYGCESIIGTDGGIIDGDRYCAGCVADESRVSARAKGGR